MPTKPSNTMLPAQGGAIRHGSASVLGRAVQNLFSFPVMLAAGLAVITVLTVSSRFTDPDLWFHLKLGQVVWTTHSIPATDIFSFTARGHAWIAHEWLAELGTYTIYRLGGYSGLMLSFMILASLLFVLVFVHCHQRCGGWLAAFLGGVCALFFSLGGLTQRPHLLGYALLVTELILLERASRNRRWLWFLPPLFALWVNCHGSYFFGMGVLVVYWACSFVKGKWALAVVAESDRQERKALGVVLLLCALALCVNPIGYRLPLYPLNVGFGQTSALNAVQEWLPPDLRSGRALAMIAAVIGIPLLCSFRRVELPLRDLLVLAAAFLLALEHVRMLFVFGIVVSPVLCQLVAPLLGRDKTRDSPIANGLFMCGFLAAMVWAFPSPAELQRQVSKQSPAAAVDYIRRSKLSGPMLNEYVFGDYLIWAFPEEKVFIDGRGDVFDWTGVLQEYGRWATLQEDPRILLDKYKIQFCLMSKDAPMSFVLPYLPGWRKVYSDDVAMIFTR